MCNVRLKTLNFLKVQSRLSLCTFTKEKKPPFVVISSSSFLPFYLYGLMNMKLCKGGLEKLNSHSVLQGSLKGNARGVKWLGTIMTKNCAVRHETFVDFTLSCVLYQMTIVQCNNKKTSFVYVISNGNFFNAYFGLLNFLSSHSSDIILPSKLRN
jgi:hypothetical protein